MIKILSGLAFGLVLLCAASAFASGVPASTPDGPPILLVAEETLPVGEILHMDTDHLLVLGAGVVAGVTVIGPYLGTGELVAVVLGVIAGEILYRSSLWPFRSRGWFQ